MLPMQKYEVNIDYCPSCKGVWLDRGEIDKIAKIQSNYEDEHINQYHYRNGEYDDYYYIITDIEGEDFSMTCLTIKRQPLKLS